ncbi:hypothetical protein P3T39_001945 [Kitasatospora sp. GP82]|nr:hypothetical protein [Kitasatospora sp. GP82]
MMIEENGISVSGEIRPLIGGSMVNRLCDHPIVLIFLEGQEERVVRVVDWAEIHRLSRAGRMSIRLISRNLGIPGNAVMAGRGVTPACGTWPG